MKAIELFSGAGGLGLGLSLAGFEPISVVEWDRWACDTIRERSISGLPACKGLATVRGRCSRLDSLLQSTKRRG